MGSNYGVNFTGGSWQLPGSNNGNTLMAAIERPKVKILPKMRSSMRM